MKNAMPMKLAVSDLVLKLRQKNLGRKWGRLDDRTEQQLFRVESIMSNGNLKLTGEKSKEMYPHSVPLSQVKRFLLKKRSCPMSPKYVEMNANVPKTFTKSTDAILSPSASGSPSTSKFVTCSTTITSPKNVEMNAKVLNTATNSTIAILSPSASGSQSTSKFVTRSTTLTPPTGHHISTNPVINRTVHDTVTNPIATFSVCLGELVHSSGATVTLPMLHTVENTATVCTHLSSTQTCTSIHS